jgi:hypothetical protein
MISYTEKFQRLLRELFQFDCADLDFGIYRIMNYKWDVIERFITKDLPETIAEELDRGKIDYRQVVVIWRETEGWEKSDLERDKKFVADQKLTEGVDEVFVNGDSFIPNARALEPMFKARMFAEVQT